MSKVKAKVTLHDGSQLFFLDGYQAHVDEHSNRLTVMDKLSAKTVLTLEDTGWKRLEYAPEVVTN